MDETRRARLPGVTKDPYIYWLGKNDNQSEWGFRFYSLDASPPNRIFAYIWNLDGGLGAGAQNQAASWRGTGALGNLQSG